MFVFSKNVKEVMQQRGMSLREMGEKIGVNSSTLSKLFSHKTKGVTLSLLHDICNELDLPIEKVLVPCDKETEEDIQRCYLKDSVERINFLSNELAHQTMIIDKIHKKYEPQDTNDGKYIEMHIDKSSL